MDDVSQLSAAVHGSDYQARDDGQDLNGIQNILVSAVRRVPVTRTQAQSHWQVTPASQTTRRCRMIQAGLRVTPTGLRMTQITVTRVTRTRCHLTQAGSLVTQTGCLVTQAGRRTNKLPWPGPAPKWRQQKGFRDASGASIRRRS